ncbi:GreA/GreB family elongation factor [Streptomyces mirabilis]
MSEKMPLTAEGAERLREELKTLKNERGDRDGEAQAFADARISHIETVLARAEIIDPTKLTGSKVQFGATVGVTDADSSKTERFQLVGPEEADPKNGRISITSSLGKALIGHEVGDSVEVQDSAAGRRELEILDVMYV